MDPKLRFSGRVADYVRFRPGYPPELVDHLEDSIGLTAEWVIADLGSGTGLSAQPFLERGNVVHGVEPLREMREAAENLHGRHPGFRSVAGSAEATGLADGSIDLVVAAQAFHWFDHAAARAECMRILRGRRPAAVVWNMRSTDCDEFARGYEAHLQRWGTDYLAYRARRIDPEELTAFFGVAPMERRMDNEQIFDWNGLRGRHLSSSYVPAEGQPTHQPMMEDLQRLFEEHAVGGHVRFRYDTQLFVGTIA
jgi:SAM-dependent methyltransferase